MDISSYSFVRSDSEPDISETRCLIGKKCIVQHAQTGIMHSVNYCGCNSMKTLFISQICETSTNRRIINVRGVNLCFSWEFSRAVCTLINNVQYRYENISQRMLEEREIYQNLTKIGIVAYS